MNTVLQAYRQQNPNDTRPDDVLNVFLAEAAPDLLDQFPDFAVEYRDIRRSLAPGLWQEFKGSVGSAIDNLQSTGLAAGAMASDLVGADGVKNYLLQKAREQAAEASTYDPTVRSYRDIETPMDLLHYAAYGAGQVVPSAAESAAFALAGGGIGGLAARQGVKGAAEEVVKQAIRRGVERGSLAGLAAATIPQSQGEIYQDIADQPNAAKIAAVAGTFAGMLDMIPEGYVLGKFFKEGDVVAEPVKRSVLGYVKTLGLEAAKTMPMEGSTEAAQELIGIAAGKYARGEPPTLNNKDVEQILNAGFIGAIGGAVFAPMAAIGEGSTHRMDGKTIGPADIEPVVQPKTSDAVLRAAEASAEIPSPDSPDFVGPPSPAFESARAMELDRWAEEKWRQSDKQMGLLKQDLARRQFTANDQFDAGLMDGIDPVDAALATSPVDNFLRNGTPAAQSAQVFDEQFTSEERMRQSPQGAEALRADLQSREVPAELEHIAKVQEAVANAAQAVAQMQSEEILGEYTPHFTQSERDAIINSAASETLPPEDPAFIAPHGNPMRQMAIASDPRELAAIASLSLDPVEPPATSPQSERAPLQPTVVYRAEPEVPVSLSAEADQALASTREIEDFRDNAYTDPMARIQRLRDDAHAGDNLQRAVLIIDRATGQLYQRGVREAGGGLTVDAAARPAPAGHGRGQGRVLDIDFTGATSGSRIDRVLKQTLADGSDRYEVVGFTVLERGAAKNLNLGDARAYLSAPQFAEKKAARLIRKQQAEMKADQKERQVKRSRKVVSESKVAAERGQPGAVEASVDNVRPVSSEDRFTEFMGQLVEFRKRGVSDSGLLKHVERMLRTLRPDLSATEIRSNAEHVLAIGLPHYEQALQTIRFTTPESMRLSPVDAVGLFQNVVRSIRETGGDVALFEQSLGSEFEAVRNAYGLQVTLPEGRSLIAIGAAALQNPHHVDNLVKLMHEAGHHFVKTLPLPMQQAFHDALNRSHWSSQRWLMNPMSLDIRLLANAKPETLSSEQKTMLAKLTPEEVAKLRQTPPDVLLIEQGAEHLAMLGMDKAQARGLIQGTIRFVKDMLLRMGMAIQRALGGTGGDRMIRAYVENRWLQFVNRDFAMSRNAALDFRTFIGAPATFRETVQTFSNLGSGDPRVGEIDLATGHWSPVEHAISDTASLRADVMEALQRSERGLADLTRRVSATSINYTPEVTFNRDAAVINFFDSLYRGIFRNPEIHRLLSQEILTADNPQATFNQEFLGLRLNQHPSVMMDELRGLAVSQKDPLTGRPINLNDRITIAELPKMFEERTGPDGNTVKVEVSSAQDSAMRSVLASLDSTVNRVSRRIAEDEKWVERARQRKSLSDEDRAKVTQLDSRTALAKKVLAELRKEQKLLESKLERSVQQHFYPGAEYLVPPTPDAKEASFETRKLPVDLSFSTDVEKAFVGHLTAMRAWLDNPANRAEGSLYVQIQRQYKALNEDFTTRYAYQRANKIVRKSFGRSLVETLKTIGTPTSLHAARRIINFQNWIYHFENDAKIRGAQWSKAYQEFAKALGKKTNESFEETVWDSLMRAGEQVNETDTQARERIAAVLRDIHGLPVDRANKKVWAAFSDLVTQTRESQKWELGMFNEMGLKVSDPTLGDKAVRRLAQIGYFNGRRTSSKLVDSLFIQMNPAWAETGGRKFVEEMEQVAGNRESFAKLMGRLFPEPVVRDFVEPLVRNNSPFITLRDQGQLTPFDIRMAWEKSGGDMLRFVQNVHEQANAGGDFAETAADVLNGFSRMFHEVRTDAMRRRDTELSSTETTPRQMMDARQADNWPPEWVSYAKYDSSSNYTLLMQHAIQAGIGDGGFGPNSEFTHLISQSLEDIKRIRVEFDELVRQGLTPEQVRDKLGADKYEKALHADDYRWLLTKFVDNAKALTKTNGYQIGDMKVMIQLLGLVSSATLQQPKSALLQSFDPFLAPFWKTKLSPTTFKMVAQGFRSMFAEGANALGANSLAEWARNGQMVERRLRAGIKDPDAYVSFMQKSADAAVRRGAHDGPESVAATASRWAAQGISHVREAMNVGVPVKADAVKIRPLGMFNTVSQAINNAFFDQVYNSMADLGIRGVEWIEANGGAEAARKLAAGEVRLTNEALGYNRSWLVLNDKPAFEYLSDAVVSKMGERSLEDFVVKAWQRKQAANGGAYEVIDNKQLMGVTTMAMSDMSLHADAINAPLALMNSPFLRLFSTYLVWPWLQMIRGMNVFKTVEGRLTAESAFDGLTVVMLGAVPATLAASLVADLYDEKVTGKRSNLRELPDNALIPGMAVAYPMASLERLARFGAFGLASEAVNGMLNQDDARGGFSADNRVFLLNQFQNARNLIGNLFQQEGNITYQSVGRPLLQSIGMNGALQYWQIANKQLGLQNTEAEINARINASNYLRATGRAMDLDVRSSRAMSSLPTPITPYLQQMELGASTGDTALFNHGFARAVQEAADSGKEDPVKYVKQAFADRHPLRRIFRTLPSQTEYRQMLAEMDDYGRMSVSQAVTSYNSYLTRLGMPPILGKSDTKAALRRSIARTTVADARMAAALATYGTPYSVE